MEAQRSSGKLALNIFLSLCLTTVVFFIGNWFVRDTSFLSFEADIKSTHDIRLSLAFAVDTTVYFDDDKSIAFLGEKNNYQIAVIPIPEQRIFKGLRLDIENSIVGTQISIKEIKIKNLFSSLTFKGNDLVNNFSFNDNLKILSTSESEIVLLVKGGNPKITLKPSLDTIQDGKLNRFYTRSIGFTIVIVVSVLLFIFLLIGFYKRKIKSMRTLSENMLTILFLIVIIVPALFMFSIPVSNISQSENRRLSPYPADTVSLHEFPKRFSGWFNDHFAWRENIILINRRFHSKVFGQTIKSEEVVEGKEGWLYFSAVNVINDGYLNQHPFSKEEIKYISERFDEQNKWLKERNCDFYLMIVPNKETIYPEFLPDNYIPEKNENRTDQILNSLYKNSPDLAVIDSRITMREAKKKNQVFYSADTHWNMIGAISCYHVLCEKIKEKYPDFLDIDPVSVKYVTSMNSLGGDLDKLLHGKATSPQQDFVPKLGKEYTGALITKDVSFPGDSVCKSKSIMLINPRSGKKLKILIFRDSFSEFFLTYLANQSDTTIAVWTHQFLPQIIEREKPDIVIHEMLERFFPEMLYYKPLNGKEKAFYSIENSVPVKE